MVSLTQAELEALPESKNYIDEVDQKTSITTRTRVCPRFTVYKPKPDDVFLFRDREGLTWFVDYHLEGGPYKRRAYL